MCWQLNIPVMSHPSQGISLGCLERAVAVWNRKYWSGSGVSIATSTVQTDIRHPSSWYPGRRSVLVLPRWIKFLPREYRLLQLSPGCFGLSQRSDRWMLELSDDVEPEHTCKRCLTMCWRESTLLRRLLWPSLYRKLLLQISHLKNLINLFKHPLIVS